MAERFRPATADDLEPVARLVAHSFPRPGGSPAAYREAVAEGPHGGLEALWVGEADGRAVAACQLLRLRQWIGGVAVPVMGLALVTISPVYRRRGIAARMVEAGFAHARERGDVASALYPFRVGFYERLGYGLAGEALQYRLPPRAFPDDPQARARLHLVERPEDEAAMRDVYAAAAARETGQMARTERNWRKVWNGEAQAAALYRGDDGQPEGYAIVRYPLDLPPDRRFLEVQERMWLTPAARRGVYAWIASLGDQWREVVYHAHPEEGFAEAIAEPRLPREAAPEWGIWFPSATVMRGPMFRLLDLGAAFALRRAGEGAEAEVVIEVDDAQVPENGGRWRLHVSDGRMRAEPEPDGRGPALRVGISALSRIYAGDLSPTQAARAGLLHAERAEVLPALDAAFLVPRPWTFERF